MKKQQSNSDNFHHQMSKEMNLAYLDQVSKPVDNIAGVLVVLAKVIRLDARVSHINLEGVDPVSFNFQACMAIYKDYVNKLPPLSNPVSRLSALCERNDVVFSPDKVEVLEEKGDDAASLAGIFGTKLGIVMTPDVKDKHVLAMVCAEVIAYTTTHDVDDKMGSVLDPVKAKKLRIPYVFPVAQRTVMNVSGLHAPQSRDAMYEKLKNKWTVTAQLLDSIYSLPGMRRYAENDQNILISYNALKDVKDHKREMWLPKPKDMSIDSTTSLDLAWRFVADSRGVRGEDNRGVGPISIGYMWYDMERSLFIDLAMVQDLLSYGDKTGSTAVQTDLLNPRTMRMLVFNGMSVYNVSASVLETDTSVAGVYPYGKRPSFKYISLSMESPTVRAKMVDYTDIGVKVDSLKRVKKAVAHMYLHPSLKNRKDLALFPSFRAHSGMVLVSGGGVQGYAFDTMVSRFFEANYVRNNYPFSRVTYSAMDGYFTYFRGKIVVPRNLPREYVVDEKALQVKMVQVRGKKVDFEMDVELVEQVEIRDTVSEVLNSFHQELLSFDNPEKVLRQCYNYPHLSVDSEWYANLISVRPDYSIVKDSWLMEKYGDMIKKIVVQPVVTDEVPFVQVDLLDVGEDDDVELITEKKIVVNKSKE